MIKILSVFGTRPEAIKMAPVILELNRQKGIEHRICVTGQHKEMLWQVLDLFAIKPEYDLQVMKESQALEGVTASILLKLTPVLKEFAPHLVLVHGDTNTTLSASLAAYYQKIPVGHVEAGLRTGDPYSPFPEELNRQITGRIASIHFAPTPQARLNLLKEGIKDEQIIVCGNTVIDALHLAVKKIGPSERKPEAPPLILVTGHRRENFGSGMESICQALAEIAQTEQVEIVYAVHLNPMVQDPVKRILGSIPNIKLLPPLEYLSFVTMMRDACLILTDSGGIQEEGPALGKPVLVMRDITERPEAIEAGTCRLTGSKTESIVKHVHHLLHSKEDYDKMAKAVNPFGDGLSSQRIVEFIVEKYGN